MKAVYTQYHLIEYLTQEMRIEIRDESSIHSISPNRIPYTGNEDRNT